MTAQEIISKLNALRIKHSNETKGSEPDYFVLGIDVLAKMSRYINENKDEKSRTDGSTMDGSTIGRWQGGSLVLFGIKVVINQEDYDYIGIASNRTGE